MHPQPAPSFFTLSARTVGIACAVITVLIWTSFILIARASADPSRGGSLTPFDIVFCRIVGASLILLPWGWWLVQRDRVRGAGQSSLLGLSPLPWRVTLRVGLFGGLLYALLAYNGFVYAPAGHASVLLPGSLPLWTALLAVLFLGERLSLLRGLGLGLIVLGDLLVGGASLLHAFDGGSVWRGDLLFMAGAFCWSVYSVLARHHALDAVRATVAITAFAFCTFVPVYAVLLVAQVGGGHLLQAPLRDIIFQAVFQGWGSVVVSGITFTKMIQYFGPIKTTMITALVPGLSALGAVVFLGEPMGWNLGLGLALVTLGILFGVRAVKSVAIKKEAALTQSASASA
jgi:drug/metabolite transporter (DMT)-like permease